MIEMMHISIPFWHFIIRGTLVYAAVLLLLRLGGKREVGQMGTGDFVAILLISNAVQNSMNGGDNSITGGLILAVVIMAWSITIAYTTYKSKKAANIILGAPTLLIHDGRILDHNLRKELLSRYELKAILRRQGIHDISDIHAAILESDGVVSINRMSETEHSKKDDQSV